MHSRFGASLRIMAGVSVCTCLLAAFHPAVSQAQTQACCTLEGTCSDLPSADCITSGGIPAGVSTSCIHSPNICTIRPCCVDDVCEGMISPQFCQEQSGTPLPLGAQCEQGLPCPQENCEPAPDGQSCGESSCILPGNQCAPRCVSFSPGTGDFTVLDCECRDLQECRVSLPMSAPTTPCTLPDNGSGTADLPPDGCSYTSPDIPLQIYDGLPAGAIINAAPTHGTWSGVTRSPGGIFGGEIEQFSSVLTLEMTGTGALAGFHRVISLTNTQCINHTGPRSPGEAIQSFPVEIMQLQGQITGDPDFDLLRVTMGDNLDLFSGGITTLVQLPGGNFAVDSFFDIFYQIEFIGAPGGALAGMAGSSMGLGRLESGIPLPNCMGFCPQPETSCTRSVVGQPDGSVTVCCDCSEPPPPQECRPTPDGSACEPGTCASAAQQCLPVAFAIGGLGETIITACECRGFDGCQVQNVPGDPQCAGSCNDGREGLCHQVATQMGFDCSCTCMQNSDCDDLNECTVDSCDVQSGTCSHTALVCDDQSLCTTDTCDSGVPGGCVYTPINCEDGDLCTADTCHPEDGSCEHPAADCDDGDPCTDDSCEPQTGCVHTLNPVTCPPVPKWSQPPTPDREAIASNVGISVNGIGPVNKVLSDDFRSDGRPIRTVQWWGSYLDPQYAPAAFGGAGQSPSMIDGWLISFHRPQRAANGEAQPPLGLYFAPAAAVQISEAAITPCDELPVFSYTVHLADCCLIQSNPDARVPVADACRCPAKPDYFCERSCYWYSLTIQAVIGANWAPTGGGACCERVLTANTAASDVWGWRATDMEPGRREALQSMVALGPDVQSTCSPLIGCGPLAQWLYGPWTPAAPVCPFPHRVNMAFVLLTSVMEAPPPCPPLLMVSASSVKDHVPGGGGPATSFGVDLPLDPPAAAGVEDRLGAPHRAVVFFSEPITADDGSLDQGDEVVASGATISGLSILGNQLQVDLTGVSSPSCVRLQIENGPDGITTLGGDDLQGDNDVHVRVLTGDANGDGTVNIFDLVTVRNNLNASVAGSNFTSDVNADAAINIFDLVTVRNGLNASAVCP